jgi:large subunit ribosomal protein L22
MAITVKLRQLKISARKVRLVADLIRYKPVFEAEALLNFTAKKSSAPILKLLRSAMAAAKNTHQADPNDFYIAKIMVSDGPMQERVFPRSRGRADKIQKRTSHITLTLEEKAQSGKLKAQKKIIKNQK